MILVSIYGNTDKTAANSGIRYKSIRYNMQNMTKLQFKEYCNSITDEKILWTGYVSEVKEKWFGGYEVLVDMDAPNSFSIQDVTFDISKEVAMKLSKNRRIVFEGEIKDILNVLGSCQVMLKNVIISS
jgi:hypothetical protein